MKHYRLTNDEWLKAVHELTGSEKDILFYIRTLDPFGDRHLNLGVRELAEILRYNPGTVSRALKSLSEKEYIDLELVNVRIKVLSKGKEVLSQNNTVVSEQQTRSQDNKHDPETTNTILRQQIGSQDNKQAPELLQAKVPETSHTIQTLNTIQTLSNSTGGSEVSEVNQEEEKQGECLESIGQIISSQVQLGMIPTDTVEDQNSARPPQAVENNNLPLDYEHPIAKMERNFKSNANVPAWRTGIGPNSFKPEFVEWILKWLSSIPPARQRSKGDAIAYILKQERSGNLDVLEARAEEWLASLEKLAESQRQQQQIVKQAVAPVAVEVPEDQEERQANFHKINEIIQSSRHRQVKSPVSPKSGPHVKSKPPQIFDAEIDVSDLITRLSLQKMRLGWESDQFQGWFIENYGATSDRLEDGQLLNAVKDFETVKA